MGCAKSSPVAGRETSMRPLFPVGKALREIFPANACPPPDTRPAGEAAPFKTPLPLLAMYPEHFQVENAPPAAGADGRRAMLPHGG